MQSLPELFRNRRREAFPPSVFEEFNQIQKRMDKLMSNLEVPVFDAKFDPGCEVEDRDTHYVLSFDMPGVKKEDIQITLENNLLTVTAERHEQEEHKRKNKFRSQQFYGSYERSFSLPPEVKANQIESDYHDGVLRVAIPKTKALQGERIQIGDGKSGVLSQLNSGQGRQISSGTEAREKKLN